MGNSVELRKETYSHILSYICSEEYDNCYYIPPNEAQEVGTATLNRWISQLKVNKHGFGRCHLSGSSFKSSIM
jgi:hypothetical protein